MGAWKFGSAEEPPHDENDGGGASNPVEDVELQACQNVSPTFLFLCVTTCRAYTQTQKTTICIQDDDDMGLFRRMRVEFDKSLGPWRRALSL